MKDEREVSLVSNKNILECIQVFAYIEVDGMVYIVLPTTESEKQQNQIVHVFCPKTDEDMELSSKVEARILTSQKETKRGVKRIINHFIDQF